MQPLRGDDPVAIDGYELRGRLGEGGQGVVYQARALDGQPVALKWMHTAVSVEAKALRRVDSPNVARVLAEGVHERRPYLVTQYVDGLSLEETVRAKGGLGADELLGLARATAGGLMDIHRAGLVHRDLKPANVLLGPGAPYVVDFGLARGQRTVTAGSGGSLPYMSPEQVRGERPGPPSDVFSWAGTMLFAATGAPPFREGTTQEIRARILHGEPDLSTLPAPLAGILSACLAKRADRRPSAGDLVDLLHDRPRKVLTRRRVLAGAVVAAAGILLVRQAAAEPRFPGMGRMTGEFGLGSPDDATSREVAVLDLALAALDSRPVAIAGCVDGTVRVLDLTTGALAGAPFAAHTTGVYAVACTGGTVISGSGDGVVLAWDLATRQTLAPAFTEHLEQIDDIVLTTVGGRVLAVTGGYDGKVRLLDPATATRIGEPLAISAGDVQALTAATLNGRPVVIAGSGAGRLHAWDAATSAPVWKQPPDRVARVFALAAIEIDGRPVVLAGGDDRALRIWDLATGEPVGDALNGHEGRIDALAAVLVGGRPVAVTGSHDKTVRAWDLLSSRQIGRPWSGHPGEVLALAAGPVGGRQVALSAGSDGKVRVWALE